MKEILQNALEALKKRMKNPYFFIGIIGTIFLSAGIDFSTVTTWGIFFDSIKGVLMNPYLLCYVIMSLMGTFVDNSTPGIKDIPKKKNK